MIIKNTDILVRRAKEHASLDHIARGTYGNIKFLQNGESETTVWRGCAISCLATESSIEALKNQEDLDFEAVKISVAYDGRTEFEVRIDENELRIMLSEKFGMCDKLIFMAECIFEGSDEDFAIAWPQMFSESLRDGVNITDQHIEEFWSGLIGTYFEPDDYNYFPIEFGPGKFRDDDWGIWSVDEYFDFCDSKVGEAFIEFIENIVSQQTNNLAVV